jgi:tetratricopeptide (TPR) repeat protein
MVGDKDFNYYEVLELDEKMDALGIPHRVKVFPGGHEWPPEAAITAALGWLELEAMRRGTRDTSPALVAGLWEMDLLRAHALEESGLRLEADRAYAALAADFAGLKDARDVEDVTRRRTALEATDAFQHDRAAQQERDRRDRDYLERVPKILAAANPEMGREGLSQTLTELSVPELKRHMAAATDPAERLSAARLLSAVYIQTALHQPREAAERKQYDRAIFDLEIAAEIDPAMAQIPFRLAVTWAQKGDRRQALDALATAVDKGWTDLLALESERAFDPLRQSSEYKTIVSELLRRQRPADNPNLNPLPRAAPLNRPDRERSASPPPDHQQDR